MTGMAIPAALAAHYRLPNRTIAATTKGIAASSSPSPSPSPPFSSASSSIPTLRLSRRCKYSSRPSILRSRASRGYPPLPPSPHPSSSSSCAPPAMAMLRPPQAAASAALISTSTTLLFSAPYSAKTPCPFVFSPRRRLTPRHSSLHRPPGVCCANKNNINYNDINDDHNENDDGSAGSGGGAGGEEKSGVLNVGGGGDADGPPVSDWDTIRPQPEADDLGFAIFRSNSINSSNAAGGGGGGQDANGRLSPDSAGYESWLYPFLRADSGAEMIDEMQEAREVVTLITAEGTVRLMGRRLPRKNGSAQRYRMRQWRKSDYLPNDKEAGGLCLGATFDIAANNGMDLNRRFCIIGFCRSVDMLVDVVEETVLQTGGNVVLCERGAGGLSERLSMTVHLPSLWSVPPALDPLKSAIRVGGGVVDRVYKQWGML